MRRVRLGPNPTGHFCSQEEAVAPPGRTQECPEDRSIQGPRGGAPRQCWGGSPPPSSLLGHSPEALQEGHVAQSLSENSQGGVAQGEVAEAGGEGARGGLGIDADRGLSSPTA